MRYIGNKTRLLGFIGRVLDRRGICRGRAVDPFTGTASVARELKRRGFGVRASDIMEYGHVFGHAYVQATEPPTSPRLAEAFGLPDGELATVITYLNTVAPEPGFIHELYTPAGERGQAHGRMYFTPDNGARIDAIRSRLEQWRAAAWIDDDTHSVLLATLIEAADRIANTTGVYAAFVKSWQSNARRPLMLHEPTLVTGNGCHSKRADAMKAVREAGEFDLLYLDPPYNTRQYAGYYHIPELIARGWFNGPVETRGKTGLLADADLRSDWSRAHRCKAAFEQLIASARCKHIVMSYNAEGIIPEPTIKRVLQTYGRRRTYRKYRHTYKRYRSDADGARRRYRGDTVDEYLYCVDR